MEGVEWATVFRTPDCEQSLAAVQQFNPLHHKAEYFGMCTITCVYVNAYMIQLIIIQAQITNAS